jgi:hypothetical protein
MTPPPAPPDLPAEARTGDGIHWNYNRICIVDAKASGYVTGTWVHHPSAPERVSHAAMNGRTFKLDVGLWDPVERRNVLPGELESCSCTFTAAEKKKKGCFGAAALFALAPLAALAWRLFG